MANAHDLQILRELARQYAEIAAKPIQDERRELWSAHNALKPTRPLILTSYGMHNQWCRQVFNEELLQCEDPFFRGHELALRLKLFRDPIGDDCIAEPWVTQRAAVAGQWEQMWGVREGHHDSNMDGGAWRFDPPIKEWADLDQLTATPHRIDENATRENVARLTEAIGDIITVNVDRTPCYHGFSADISTDLAKLRGLEQVMVDMYESPEELHRLLAFMRDGIIANNDAAEAAGDYSLTSASNQSMAYADGLEPLRANSGIRRRQDLWGFCAAQEFTLISPAFHDEFLLQYQQPIMAKYALIHYGCCENLTRKIEVLRNRFQNLRSIAVTPTADIAKCAEQIGTDFVISWRPNPTDMVCCMWNVDHIRKVVKASLEACRGQYLHIHLKDVETVQGEPDRLQKWVAIVRDVIDQVW